MILTVGATGILGGMITQRLLEQGRDVRILVRRNSPSEELAKQGMATSAQSLIVAGAKPVYGDLKDRASLDPACEGVETIVTTANSVMRGGEDTVQTVDLEGNRNLVDSAQSAGVKHFVFVSVLGADVNHPAPLYQAKAKTEERLRSSDMSYTILALDVVMEVWIGLIVGTPLGAGQPVTLVREGRRVHSFVSFTDVAAFATAAVDHPAGRNQRIPIGGPRAVSWREIVGAVGNALGQELPIRWVAPGEPVPLLAPEIGGLLANLETYDTSVDMAETVRTFNLELTTVEAFAARLFGGVGS
jgi:NADH dehydrogenase